MTEHIDEFTGELLPAVAHTTSRTVDLRDRHTDSWTDVLDDVIALARGIANTEFVPKGLRGSTEKVSAAVLYSRELGLPPMTGLGGTHVIEGKAGISAELMRALVLQAGHELAIKKSDRTVCEIWGRRKGSDEWTKATWTIQEAGQTQVFISKDKGWGPLSSKPQWRSWPTEMLLARATTRLVRMIFPDVAHGMRSVEELQDMQVEEGDGVVEQAPPAAPVQRQRKTPPASRAAAPVADVVDVEAADVVEEPAEAPQAPPGPVQRQRVGRPEPRPATAPPAAAKPAPAAPAEVVDAEVDVLPDEPEPPAPPAATDVVDAEVVDPAEPAESSRRKGSMVVTMRHFERLGVKDRNERLWLTGEHAGRKVTSTNDLDDAELRALADDLERSKTLQVFQAKVDQRRVDQS